MPWAGFRNVGDAPTGSSNAVEGDPVNILTKVSIVVLVVLVVIASVLVITQTTLVDNYKEWYRQAETARRAVAHEAQLHAIGERRANDLLTQTRQDLIAQARQSQQRVRELQDELAQKEFQLGDLQKQLATLNAQINDVSVTLENEVEAREQAVTKYQDLREEYDTLRDRQRQLNESLKRSQSEVASYQEMSESLQEQIANLEQQLAAKDRQIEQLRTTVAQGGGASATQPTDGLGRMTEATTDKKISGRVQTVRDGMASINVGRAQGVQKGMVLMIHRGANFVGWLRVERVEAGEAAGFIEDAQFDVQQGDRVATLASIKS